MQTSGRGSRTCICAMNYKQTVDLLDPVCKVCVYWRIVDELEENAATNKPDASRSMFSIRIE